MTRIDTALNSIAAYGEMYEFNALGSSITITTAGTYYPWITATAGLVDDNSNVTFVNDAGGDKLRIAAGNAGTYEVQVSVSFGGTGNSFVEGTIALDDVAQNKIHFNRKLGVGGDQGVSVLSGLIDIDASQHDIDLRFTSDGNGDTVTVYACNVLIKRIDY